MAQLVARLVRNEKVGGSNPPSSTTSKGLSRQETGGTDLFRFPRELRGAELVPSIRRRRPGVPHVKVPAKCLRCLM